MHARLRFPTALLLAFWGMIRCGEAQLVPDGGSVTMNNVTNTIAGNVTIGTNGLFTQLTVTGTALLTNSLDVFVGQQSGARSNTAVIDGVNTRWFNGRDFYVGSNGAANTLVITNGGRQSGAGYAYIGWGVNASNNSIQITGTNSTFTNAGIFVGYSGSFNKMLISLGAKVANDFSAIGEFTNSRGNSVAVTDSGSVWTNLSGLYVGIYGSGNSLLITNGAAVVVQSFSGLVVGDRAVAGGNIATVSGSGSRLTVNAGVNIGNNGANNSLYLLNGAKMTNTFCYVGGNSGADYNSVVVDGFGTGWRNTGELVVGQFGSGNLVTIRNGAQVTSGEGIIGDGTISGGNNNEVRVQGPGTVWASITNFIYVGDHGTGNQLTISDGATVNGLKLIVGNSPGSANNLLVVNGATLQLAGGVGGADLDVRNGTAILNGGSITAGRLQLNYAITGGFVFNAGTLAVGNSSVANGVPFVVGNSVSNSIFRMTGLAASTHTFANGFVISTNAALTGNGTIVGNVTNYGTLSPGSSAGSLTIKGDLVFQPSATAVFEIGGRAATNGYDQVTVTNFVQFAGALDLRLTNNFLPAPGDTFTLVKFGSSSNIFNGVNNGQRKSFFGGKASFFVTYDTNLTLSAIQYADSDGDGTPDLFEDAAGTDATNAASVLRLIPVSVSGSGAVTLRFPYVSGKAYRMQWSDSVASNAWSVIASPVLVENVPGFYDWVDDGTFTGGLATPARAYRVGLGP